MKIASHLLKAHHIGIRELKQQATTQFFKTPLIITDRGVPISVNLPYSDVLELVDILDEISDKETVAAVLEGRKAIKAGAKGVPVQNLFRSFKKKRK